MKVEIRKETRFDGVVYWTYVDNVLDHAYYDLERAEARFEELVAKGKTPPIWETIKEEEV